MKRKTWHKQHKWAGLAVCIFLLMFCLSGILLNHRSWIKDVNVSRSWLPSRYDYHDWNGGLLRGTIPVDDKILIYGSGGMWLTDSVASELLDFNEGLPEGADYRQIRSAVVVQGINRHHQQVESLFAVSPFSLYRYGLHGVWNTVPLPLAEGERLTDLTCHGDTLVAVGRSHLYVSKWPFRQFRRITLPAPSHEKQRVTAFRTVWLLHSGELFGDAGKFVVDMIGLVLIVLCLTGIILWAVPSLIRRLKRRGMKAKGWTKMFRSSFAVHDGVGKYTIILTFLIALTGWCLRPPLMIPLVLSKIPPLPGTVLQSDNAWNDRLRMLRYDERRGDWLLSSSDGFYSMKDLKGAIPVKEMSVPPVSVMGLNVWQMNDRGLWLCGSFSGMYVWDRQKGTSVDYFSHQPAPKTSGPPFGQTVVSGFTSDIGHRSMVVEYDKGTHAIAQPENLSRLPMSLWNVALEVHSGRIYFGNAATYFFVFIAGILCVWCLWSGFKIRRRRG